MKRRLVITALLAVVALTSVGVWGDLRQAGPALREFPWLLLPLVAVFGFGNDMIKFFRWHLYLRHTGVHVSGRQSLAVFVSGLSMSATPGKVGFLLKSQMLKKIAGHGLLATSPVIVAELYMDLLALSIISLAGISLLGAHPGFIVLCCVPLLGLIPAVPRRLVHVLGRLPRLKARAGELEEALDGMFRLLGFGVLVPAFGITLLAWTSEGVALSLIVRGLGFELGVIPATVIFGFATLAGVLSLLPGGLVVTDAGLLGLLVARGIPAPEAAAAALLARLFTLWLAVAVGSVTLFFNRDQIVLEQGEIAS